MPPPDSSAASVRERERPAARRTAATGARRSSPQSPASRARRTPKEELPPVDARLVMPETRFEIIDGNVEEVAPADEAHGTRHSKLSALLNDRRSDAEKVSILFGSHEKVAGDATDPPTLSLETFGGVFGRLLLESP